jgi:hypothetical protein
MGNAARFSEMKRVIQGNKTKQEIVLDLTRTIYGEDDQPLVFKETENPETKEKTIQYTTLREILAHAHAQTLPNDTVVAKRLRWDMRVRIKDAESEIAVSVLDAEAIDDLVSQIMITPIAGQVHRYIVELIEGAAGKLVVIE